MRCVGFFFSVLCSVRRGDVSPKEGAALFYNVLLGNSLSQMHIHTVL